MPDSRTPDQSDQGNPYLDKIRAAQKEWRAAGDVRDDDWREARDRRDADRAAAIEPRAAARLRPVAKSGQVPPVQLLLREESPLRAMGRRSINIMPSMIEFAAAIDEPPALVDHDDAKLPAPLQSILPAPRQSILTAALPPDFGTKRAWSIRIKALIIHDMLISRASMAQRRRGGWVSGRLNRAEIEAALWPPDSINQRNSARHWAEIQSALLLLQVVAADTGLRIEYWPKSSIIAYQVDYRGRRFNGPQFHPGLLQACAWQAVSGRRDVVYRAYVVAIHVLDQGRRGVDAGVVGFNDFLQAVYDGQSEPKTKQARATRRKRLRRALAWIDGHPSGALRCSMKGPRRIELRRRPLAKTG